MMNNVADEDVKRLVESQHDTSVESDEVAQNKTEQAMFDYTAARLKKQRAVLLAAVLLARKEGAETQAATTAMEQAIQPALDYYAFARARTRADLLEIDPSKPKPDPVAQAQLAREWQDGFALAPSQLDKLSLAERITRLEAQCGLIEQSAPLKAHATTPTLRALVAAALDKLKVQSKESKEDSAAMTSLRAARVSFDAAHSSHKLQVHSILTGQQRPELLARAIKSEDPAYKARRRAQQPITEEPDLDLLVPELPVSA
jgi:hypothetical protein